MWPRRNTPTRPTNAESPDLVRLPLVVRMLPLSGFHCIPELHRVALRWSWLLLLVCTVVGCETPEADSSPPFVVPSLTLPAWRGGFDVGRRIDTWTDSSRGRTLVVTSYYPAVAVDSSHRELVLGDSLDAILHRNELARKLGPAAASGLISLRTRSGPASPVAPWDERFPVLLFAPTAGWLPGDYSALLEGIASHGFVVIAFAAPGDAGAMHLPDGSVVESGLPDGGTVVRLAADLAFLHGQLGWLSGSPASPYQRRLSLSAVGVFGHGIGGAAAVLAAARDTTLMAVANLDGDLFTGLAPTMVGQPVLYVTSEPLSMARVPVTEWDEDRSERRRNEQWSTLSAGSRGPQRVRLAGMHQWNFLDAALVPPAAIAPGRRRPRFGTINGERGLSMAVDVTVQFFRNAFANSRGFDMVQALYPEASLGR